MAFTYFQKGRMNFVVNFPSILKISVSTFWVESRPGFCISRWTCIVRPRGNIKKQQPPDQFLFARHATENSTSCFHIQIKSIFFTTSHVNPTQIPTKPFPKEAAWPGMTPPLIIHDYICMQFSTILALGKDSCCLGNQKQHKHCAWLDLTSSFTLLNPLTFMIKRMQFSPVLPLFFLFCFEFLFAVSNSSNSSWICYLILLFPLGNTDAFFLLKQTLPLNCPLWSWTARSIFCSPFGWLSKMLYLP